MNNHIKIVEGGVTAAMGFAAAGVNAGIKVDRKDMALLVSDRTAVIAGTFTTNKIKGAHVKVCRKRLEAGEARAIVINSGSANACTGPDGIRNAERTAVIVAEHLSCEPRHVFMCSTGTIGKPLPMDKIEAGIAMAARGLSPTGGNDAAQAIMTTDTVDKQHAVEIRVNNIPVRVGGMSKGAGMIEPNMATMLAFLTTDARIEQKALQKCIASAVANSFNKISVDGDQSCNDTCLIMANGMAGNEILTEKHADWPVFSEAVHTVTKELALKIVKDGEGVTKFVTVTVDGAVNEADARKAVRAIGNSLLVKTSWFGGDPNWGRIIDAAGYSGAELNDELVDIFFDDLQVVAGGRMAQGVSLKDIEKIYAQKAFSIKVDLHLGPASDTVYTCDCSFEYVKINAEYMT